MGGAGLGAKRAIHGGALRSMFDDKPVWRDVAQTTFDDRSHPGRQSADGPHDVFVAQARVSGLVDDHAVYTTLASPISAMERIDNGVSGRSPMGLPDGAGHQHAHHGIFDLGGPWTVAVIHDDARASAGDAEISGDVWGASPFQTFEQAPGGPMHFDYGRDGADTVSHDPMVPETDPFFGSI